MKRNNRKESCKNNNRLRKIKNRNKLRNRKNKWNNNNNKTKLIFSKINKCDSLNMWNIPQM